MSYLLATAAACSSSSSSSSTPTPTAASGPNWHQFTITKQAQAGFTTLGSVEEMQTTGGFKFTFPSYLPEGMSTTMAVDAAPAAGSGDSAIGSAEEVMILASAADSPHITIHEQQSPVPQTFADVTWDPNAVESDVAEERIFCLTEDVANDVTNPSLKCVYMTSDQAFAFLFQWKVAAPVAAVVTLDQRQEALKVITSMIEAPAYW